MTQSLTIFSPAGAVQNAAELRRAQRRLAQRGFDVQLDDDALTRVQRFAGTDAQRLAALYRVADAAPAVALAARGGYGLSRLLDGIDWRRIAASIERGTRWVGMSDFTALQLGLLAHARGCGVTWAGPLAVEFGRPEAEGGADDLTEDCFVEAMQEELEAIGFRERVAASGGASHDGFEAEGLLWGGNLTLICALLGTSHAPKVKGGILFVEEVGEHPYRVERMLLQLQQAGVLDAQKAVLVGDLGSVRAAPNDRGYRLRDALQAVQARTKTPLLVGLPHGHGSTKVCLPVGARAQLAVQGREVMLAWGHV